MNIVIILGSLATIPMVCSIQANITSAYHNTHEHCYYSNELSTGNNTQGSDQRMCLGWVNVSNSLVPPIEWFH
jgi:hypothetical protein